MNVVSLVFAIVEVVVDIRRSVCNSKGVDFGASRCFFIKWLAYAPALEYPLPHYGHCVLYCHRHEGTNYVTRPWASDEDDIRTIKTTLALGRVSTTTTDLD